MKKQALNYIDLSDASQSGAYFLLLNKKIEQLKSYIEDVEFSMVENPDPDNPELFERYLTLTAYLTKAEARQNWFLEVLVDNPRPVPPFKNNMDTKSNRQFDRLRKSFLKSEAKRQEDEAKQFWFCEEVEPINKSSEKLENPKRQKKISAWKGKVKSNLAVNC